MDKTRDIVELLEATEHERTIRWLYDDGDSYLERYGGRKSCDTIIVAAHIAAALAEYESLREKFQAQLDLERWTPVEEGLPEARDSYTEYSDHVLTLDMKSQTWNRNQYLTKQQQWNVPSLSGYTHWRYVTLPKE